MALYKYCTNVKDCNSILIFNPNVAECRLGVVWLHFMEKCGIHCYSTVDIDFDGLPLIYKECAAFIVPNV